MTSKHLGRFEIKNASKGEVTAVFSTFNVIDKDGDVTIPGAFTDGQEVLISAYGHKVWEGALPVGQGTIRQTDSEAILEGKFFLDTDDGRNTFNVIKNVGARQEWSYGYNIIDAAPGKFGGADVQFLKRLDVTEVSPVLVGAGVNTRTLAAKAAQGQQRQQETTMSAYKRAIRPHETAAVKSLWRGVELPDDASVADLRSVHAWVDGDPELKASYRFAHHEKAGGPANLRACLRHISVLNGALGPVGIPDEDRKAVYEHLAGHLVDTDREPPELLSGSSGNLTVQDELLKTMAVVHEIVLPQFEGVDRVVALRAQKGKSLSRVNGEYLEWIVEDLHAAYVGGRSRIDSTEDEAAREYLRFVQSLSQGVTTS